MELLKYINETKRRLHDRKTEHFKAPVKDYGQSFFRKGDIKFNSPNKNIAYQADLGIAQIHW